MEKKDTLSKILAIVGTVLVWVPVLAPVVFGFISLIADGIFRFDYLMPAELVILVFVGGGLLVWAATRADTQQRIIAWGFGIALAAILALNAFGDVVPGSFRWAIAIGLLVVYTAMVVVMGIGGVQLWRDLFKKLS